MGSMQFLYCRAQDMCLCCGRYCKRGCGVYLSAIKHETPCTSLFLESLHSPHTPQSSPRLSVAETILLGSSSTSSDEQSSVGAICLRLWQDWQVMQHYPKSHDTHRKIQSPTPILWRSCITHHIREHGNLPPPAVVDCMQLHVKHLARAPAPLTRMSGVLAGQSHTALQVKQT